MPSKELQAQLSILPSTPGVYQYLDEQEKIIYVGKAKNLKKRVNSYFNKEQSGKVQVLVSKIKSIRYIVVPTELDALLLENNLIKEIKPRYNILLKDDKSYPWICIKNEDFPRIITTRKVENDGSQYFGPYPSLRMMRALLEIIHTLFPFRNCKNNLTPTIIAKKKYRVCLQYHIKKCKAPCIGAQDQNEYQTQINQAILLLKGRISPLIKDLREKMMQFAAERNFKKAQEFKEKIINLENYQSKSCVINPHIGDVDVINLKVQDQVAYANYLKVIDGAIIQSYTFELKKQLDESDEELLELSLAHVKNTFKNLAKEILLPFETSIKTPEFNFHVPKIGDKKQLLELSERNIVFHILEKNKKQDLIDPDRHSKRILNQLQKDLGMTKSPMHIECFDNSNFHGDYAVAAMTVFKNAKASKKDYRHYNIKTVSGPNDYASMEEVIYRRYKRALDENQDLPQLIVVDGGKGQLSSAYKSLQKLNLQSQVFLIGIAEKLEEIYKVGDPYPLLLDKKSESLKIIQQIRDEAHRFGITHYRKKHEKGLIKTELTEIQGIGLETALKLLQTFHSVKKISTLPLEDLENCIGRSKAELVYTYYNSNKNV